MLMLQSNEALLVTPFFTIVQMKERERNGREGKERNKNNHPFSLPASLRGGGRKNSKESKLKMSLASSLSSPVKILEM